MKLLLAAIIVLLLATSVSAEPPVLTMVTALTWFEAKWEIGAEQPHYFASGYDMQAGKQWWSTDTYEITEYIYYETDFLEPDSKGHVNSRLCKLYFYDYETIARGYECWLSYVQNLPLIIYRESWR